MQEIKLNGESMNIVEDNIEKLKTIFPDVFTEGQVDFEKLQSVLGNYIETNDERYNFTWAGKQNALRLAQTPSTGTLRPCKDENESKNWDTTQNLYIEGDNLEVLKLLQKSYHNKIKMIYIDPPYNTGNDFVYKDDFKDNIENYKKITGQVDEEGNKISSNSESDGRYHTNWLNMMYPRLRLARNLLSDDGVIFISIDDNEVNNLKKICDEVFGINNFITQFTRKGSGGRQDSKYYAIVHEYVLCYSKNKEMFTSGKELKTDVSYPFYDENRRLHYKTQLLRKWGENSRRKDRPNLYYPIIDPDGNEHYPMISSTEESCWRWGKDKMFQEIQNGKVEFKRKNNEWIAYEKIFEPTEDNPETKLYTSIIDDISNSTGASLLKALFNDKIFDYPKPVELITRIIKLGNIKDCDIILDFFSGSATTAHAVMQLNSEDNGNRKFICVQLPEQTDEKSEAYKAGYKNICEIGKERIRRAGEKIKQEIEQENQQLKLGEEPKKVPDIGFKVFKLDSSNIKKWNANTENIEEQLQQSILNQVAGRSELDVVYEIMLKCGLDLTYPIEEIKVEDKTLYSVGAGAMFICMDDNITQSIADKIISIKEENELEEPVVVFKDNGFIDDSTKTNIKESLRVAGIKDFITV